jgi:hypothetical protein
LTPSPRKSEFCASRSSHPDFDVSFDNIEYDFEAAASSRDKCYITSCHCDFCLLSLCVCYRQAFSHSKYFHNWPKNLPQKLDQGQIL